MSKPWRGSEVSFPLILFRTSRRLSATIKDETQIFSFYYKLSVLAKPIFIFSDSLISLLLVFFS